MTESAVCTSSSQDEGTYRADTDQVDSLLQVEREEQRDGIIVARIAVQPTGLGCGYRLGDRHGIWLEQQGEASKQRGRWSL
jgi:hypothetical protein